MLVLFLQKIIYPVLAKGLFLDAELKIKSPNTYRETKKLDSEHGYIINDKKKTLPKNYCRYAIFLKQKNHTL